jgi:hypothetical protein
MHRRVPHRMQHLRVGLSQGWQWRLPGNDIHQREGEDRGLIIR